MKPFLWFFVLTGIVSFIFGVLGFALMVAISPFVFIALTVRMKERK